MSKFYKSFTKNISIQFSCALTEKCFNIGKLYLYTNFGAKAKIIAACYTF